MKNRFLRLSVFLVSIAMLMQLTFGLASAKPMDNVHPGKPVAAEDVVIVKKASIQAAPARKPPKAPVGVTGTIGESFSGEQYAIIIGISDYPGTSNDLNYSDDDAEEVRAMLIATYRFSGTNIEYLVNGEASYSVIVSAINKMKEKLTVNDELFFFFSGHGAKGRAADGDNSNTDQSIVVCNDDNDGLTHIWDGELVTLFQGFKTNRLIFAFDSCLSGGMAVLKAPGRVVNMACSANGLSYESSAWGDGNGQFTYYFLLEGMGEGKADWTTDNDAMVTVEEAFDYARTRCVSQTPVISDSFVNDLLLMP